MNKMPSVGVEGHWSADKFSDNVLQDALIRHALGLTYLQMADVGKYWKQLLNSKQEKNGLMHGLKWQQHLKKEQKTPTVT